MFETNFYIHEFMNASDVVHHLEHENETLAWSLRMVLLSSQFFVPLVVSSTPWFANVWDVDVRDIG